jgi:membrane protease subunit (stomatin/prohibitin family)
MALIDVVKWDGNADELAWKFPSQELSTGTQVIVNESQEAMLVKDGAYDGPFGAGRHTLSTNNIPFLRQLIGLPFGGRSPFAAGVWFVNRAAKLDVLWGTPDPIQLQDPKFGIMVPVRAFGQYGIAVADTRTFLMKLVGTLPGFDAATVAAYFRGVLATRIKSAIARAIVDSGLSVLEVSTRLEALSGELQVALADDLAAYGVRLAQFGISSINVPESDAGVQQLKAALARRAEMDIVGYDYKQERGFDVLQSAARNPGSAGALMGAGLGTGLGVAVGASIGQTFQQLVAPVAQPDASVAPGRQAESTAVGHVERLALLRELAQLRSENVLTEDEFLAEKKRILSQ